MTDDARRRAELKAHRDDWGCTGENCEHYGCATVEKILDEWADAVAQEREACAMVVRGCIAACDCQNIAWRESAERHLNEAASKIRARGR